MEEDIWNVYPVNMEGDQAWIAYNHAFGERADSDPRNQSLRIRLEFKDPTEHGMPTNEEFSGLSALDEALDDAIAEQGGIYVGRLTVRGARYFYYYSNKTAAELSAALTSAAEPFGYELAFDSQDDPDKERYWSELFPTEDDWQVIQDLRVLEQLEQSGDNPAKEREVAHWAYFDHQAAADQFAAWADDAGFTIKNNEKAEDDDEYVVHFTHIGTMHLGDISSRTVTAGQQAREAGGRYDGWETSVERD